MSMINRDSELENLAKELMNQRQELGHMLGLLLELSRNVCCSQGWKRDFCQCSQRKRLRPRLEIIVKGVVLFLFRK